MTRQESPQRVEIDYYSDMLCVWAYIAQRRIDEAIKTFGNAVSISTRFCSVFSDVEGKIGQNWADRGGFDGYAAHVQGVARQFPHVGVAGSVWRDVRPASSAGAHLFLKAVDLSERAAAGDGFDAISYPERQSSQAAWQLRLAFFEQGRDLSDWQVQRDVATTLGLDFDALSAPDSTARAAAALAQDFDHSQKQRVEGSPTFILNAGRQKLFGNVGYRVLEANIEELLRRGPAEEVSWC